jgi:hypothetical protein
MCARPTVSVSRRPVLLVSLLCLSGLSGTPVDAGAQQVTIGEIRVMTPRRDMLPEIPGGFTFCRLVYVRTRREQRGQGWRTDYPDADWNLTTRLGQLTPTPIAGWKDGRPGFAAIRATDPELFECPFLFSSDVGTASFSPEEIERLREYILKGGFIWADDFWGNPAWTHWLRQIEQILPEWTVEELPPEHPLFSIVYHIDEIPQIPSIQYWRESGGGTSELGSRSATPRLRAIRDDSGRLLVLMSHNTDIADGWEREGEDYAFFAQFSPDAYALGINILIWTMTH